MNEITQREFINRWGMISFGRPDDPPIYESSIDPKSGYRSSHDGSFYRYSGTKDWYRPALWWEHLIALTWGRVFWFRPRNGWRHRWIVALCDHQIWGIETREYRTKLAARIAAFVWLVKLGRGTLYTPPYHLELHDMYREIAISRGWPLSEGRP